MKNTEKEFLLKKGLYLGLFFSIFPIIDLLYSANMSAKVYYIIFLAIWLFAFSFLIVHFGKEFRNVVSPFDFKIAFRTLFIISAIGLSLLTVTKITVWNILFPSNYITLNEKRDNELTDYYLSFAQSALDEAYQEGSVSDEKYDESISTIDSQMEQAKSLISEKWDVIKENGISKTIFIGSLIYNLFFIALFDAILAFFIRRKNEIV